MGSVSWLERQKLGPFLGAGCFGYVFKSSSPDLNTSETAIKFVLNDSHLSTEKRNVLDTYMLLSRKQHHHIVSVLNVATKTFSIPELDNLLNQMPSNYEGRSFEELTMLKYRAIRYKATISGVCIQMQLGGATLRQWLDDSIQRRMAPGYLHPVQLTIVEGLLEGLRYLHGHNILHRNLRPEVVYFSNTTVSNNFLYLGPIKLGGFGRCGTALSSLGDSPPSIYRAPEQDLLGGSGIISQSADLFSLGLIMWEVLQGLHPKLVRSLFFKLVNEENEEVVKEHALFSNAKRLIVDLTRRRVVDRLKSIAEVEIISRKSALSSTCPLQEDTSWLETLHVKRLLGHGAFGSVLESSSSKSAVKVIFLPDDQYCGGGSGNAEFHHSVAREYLVPVGKNHPNVVKVFRSAVHDFTPEQIFSIFYSIKENNNEVLGDAIQYRIDRSRAKRRLIPVFGIEMELCGENLRSWLQNGAESSSLARTQFQITTQLIEGLRFLHSHDIIHRDLKPENILFAQAGYTLPVKIGDFGLVRYVSSCPSSDYLLTPHVGTSLYRAPEVGTESYGHPADIFSLGLILWEVLQPLPPGSRKSLFFKLVHDYDAVDDAGLVQSHPMVDNVPQLILGMTQRLVKDRFKTMEEIVIEMGTLDMGTML